MIEQIKKSIADAELVLIGIGYEWKIDDCDEAKKERIVQGYTKLKELIAGKNYYIISLATDDLIYQVFSEDDHIVCPCGTHRYMQCDAHLIKTEDAVKKDGRCYCPECGMELVYNTVEADNYIEDGYIPKFTEYKKWLQGTVNKKLCMLELGVGLQYPSVIRLAFDKMCFYNQKCQFYRVHHSLYQHTAENSERGISINMNSLDFLTEK